MSNSSVPQDVEPGSDADATKTPKVGETPKNPNKSAPLENGEGTQQDDNIDDKGNKHGGGEQDQPT